MCFVDLEKAFDCVARDAVWGMLQEYGIGGPLLGHSGPCFYERSREFGPHWPALSRTCSRCRGRGPVWQPLAKTYSMRWGGSQPSVKRLDEDQLSKSEAMVLKLEKGGLSSSGWRGVTAQVEEVQVSWSVLVHE
ncbi:hypothetical protein CRENBAI_003393 [Crenichthys baileyi]|uniref:Reverse transcriptase domain-containing protein n=1 Tax=Crenichthys baileyi TaxID=28760 RepID=A0AAV9RAB3_9TELE